MSMKILNKNCHQVSRSHKWTLVIFTCQRKYLHTLSNVGCNLYFHHVYKHQTSPGNSYHSCTCLELNFGRFLPYSHFFVNFHLYLLQYICYHMVQSCCYFCIVSSVDIDGDMEQFQVNNPEVLFMKVFINLSLEEIPLDSKNMNVLDRRYYCSLHGQLYLDMIYIFLDKLLNKM